MSAQGTREFFSATSNVPFRTEQELHEHYRSAFHRYNLKRRVAGLGPVTREWFDTHRDKLSLGRSRQGDGVDGNQDCIATVYYDPLSKKQFNTEAKYNEFVNSNKYKKLVKANGGERPAAVLRTKQRPQQAVPAASQGRPEDMEEDGGEDDGSEWETASEDEGEEEDPDWVPWDPRASLFDNHVSASVEDNIEYMYKNFGFSIPDVEYNCDPEGLLEYLGAKITRGKIPLYCSGLDSEAKTMRSAHAVQRHMVDTGRTRMLYEGNEEEYEDFYDYAEALGDEAADAVGSLTLAAAGTSASVATTDGYSLFLPTDNKTGSSKVLGSRGLAKYYRQSHRPEDGRQSVVANRVVARYRLLGLLRRKEEGKEVAAMNDAENKRRENYGDVKLHSGIQNAVINKLPRNVPY